jgi:hypothetical protein
LSGSGAFGKTGKALVCCAVLSCGVSQLYCLHIQGINATLSVIVRFYVTAVCPYIVPIWKFQRYSEIPSGIVPASTCQFGYGPACQDVWRGPPAWKQRYCPPIWSPKKHVDITVPDAPPILLYSFIEQTLQPGPAVSLKCSSAGNPTPQIAWTLDGFPLPSNGRYETDRQLFLATGIMLNCTHCGIFQPNC